MDQLKISLSRSASPSFREMLTTHAVPFETQAPPPPDVIFMAEDDVLTLIASATPWGALATVITAWLIAKSRRKVTLITKGGESFEAAGMSVEEVESILQNISRITADEERDEDERIQE